MGRYTRVKSYECEQWWPGNSVRDGRLGIATRLDSDGRVTYYYIRGVGTIVPGEWIVTNDDGKRAVYSDERFRNAGFVPASSGRTAG